MQIPYVAPGTLLFRFLDHRTKHFWLTLADILTEQRLYLNSRTQFNDVFDSRPDIVDDLHADDFRKLARKLVRNPWNSNLSPTEITTLQGIKESGRTLLDKSKIQGLREALRSSTDEFLDRCGLTSFSLTATHQLLWAHYAAGSSGVCVVFRRGSSMQSGLCLCAKVSYVRNRSNLPLSLFYKMREAQRANKPTDKIIDRIFFLSFLHKGDDWAYEQEARIYRPLAAFEKISFHQNELVGIILGPKSSKELEARIRQEACQRVPSISVKRASLAPNGFGIIIPADFVPLVANVA